MACNSVVVILSSSCVSSNKFESVKASITTNDNVKVIHNIKSILLNEQQQKSIPIENASQFCNGAVAAYLLQSINEQEIDFDTIQKSNKLSKTDIFKTKDPYFVTKLKQFLFPQKAALEQTLIICNPPLSKEELNEISEELKLKGIFILFEDQISSQNNENIVPLFTPNNDENNEEKQENISCTAILCESFNAIDKLQIMVGCASNPELCEQFAANSWLNRYKTNNYKFIQISDLNEIEKFIPKLTSEQTLALIKPTAVSKGYAQDIINEIKQNGFTIISQKRVHLKVEHAQYFYKEHEGKPFYDELTSFMSSGPIYALILERICAIKCWRTLLGPTNTFTAKEKAPQSIRAKYGTNQTANACHGSDSTQSALREIKFYFPEISIKLTDNSDDNDNKENNLKSINIVEEYMKQKLENNETLKEFLIRGLSELAKTKPGNKLEVVEYFGKWLLENNPNKPKIEEPVDINLNEMTFIEKCKYLNGNKELKIIFILGGPGSGKGTQCKQIVEKYGFIQISTGDLFRKVVNDETNPLGIEIKEIMANGELVPTELVLKMLKEEILEKKGDKYLLDGFPRSLEQAIMFEKDLIPCCGAINFICDDNILMERCLKRAEISGRVDDNKETINKRLNTFHQETDPTVEYLKSINKINHIDATKDIDDVWKDVKIVMDNILKK